MEFKIRTEIPQDFVSFCFFYQILHHDAVKLDIVRQGVENK